MIRLKLYQYNTNKWNNQSKKFEIVEPYLYEILGSDNWRRLDGRFSIHNLRLQAVEYIKKTYSLKNVVYFEIYKGHDSLRLSELDKPVYKIYSEYL